MSAVRPTSLKLTFSQTEMFGGLEEIEVRFGVSDSRRKFRGRDWKSNARTDVLAAALSLLWLRGRADPNLAVLDSRNSAGELDLCARVHDLWHSPRKRIESHWLDAVFDEGALDLPSPLALVLSRSGARKTATLRFADGWNPDCVSFYQGGRACSAARLWQFLEERFDIPQSGSGPESNLPVYRTSLIGRETELEMIAGMLGKERLITLFGPSGVGKTRLAVEVAQSVRGFRDGVRLIDLSSVASEEAVVARVLDWFPESDEEPSLALVADRFRDMQILIILDNCETVRAEAAEVAQTIVGASKRSVLLTTSIEPLGAHGETCYRVPLLNVPMAGAQPEDLLRSASVQLFIDRARAAGVQISPGEGELRSVLEICRVVSGLPLGIELAASGVRRFPLSDLAELLLSHLDVVRSDDRSGPVRHETLGSVVEWTFGLLSETERRVFLCLSLFPSDWTLAAAASICRAVGIAEREAFVAHSRLVDLSIVRFYSETRFSMLPPLRAFARQKSASTNRSTELALAFEEHFLALAESSSLSDQTGEGIAELVPENANLQFAATSALENGRIETTIRFVEALYAYWLTTGSWKGGAEICLRLLQTPGLQVDAESRILRAVGGLEFRLGSIAAARRHYEDARTLAVRAEDRAALAHALHGLGTVAFRTDRLAEAERYFEEAAQSWRGQGNEKSLLSAVNNLAAIAATEGRFEQAAERFGQVVEMASQLGDKRAQASSLTNFGLMRWRMNHPDDAREYFMRSLELLEGLGDPWGEANVCNNLAVLCFSARELELSATYHARSLEIRERLADRAGIAASLEGFASLALLDGNPSRAVRLISAARTLRTSMELELTEENRQAVDRDYARASALLSAADLSLDTQLGSTLTSSEAIALALDRATR